MAPTTTLKLFISYSHLDENFVDDFLKHASPLQSSNAIQIWYDRKINAGQNLNHQIDRKIHESDIICLFLSANFLSSSACDEEKKIAYRLRESKGTIVIPIILSDCAWLDDKLISPHLALPADGKAIERHSNTNSAWLEVYRKLKKIVDNELAYRNIENSERFNAFIESCDMLSKSHPQKSELLLDDIFVYPELESFDEIREYERTESSEKLIDEIHIHKKILIAGENQSGKTSLCKMLYKKLREKRLIPVYVADRESTLQGKISKRIEASFMEQYIGQSFNEVDVDKIVPIIDDFHLAKYKDRHIEELKKFSRTILIVDDIFCLNFDDIAAIKAFRHFRIKELKPSLRNRLVQKWTHIGELQQSLPLDDNMKYSAIDITTEQVESALGRAIGSGLMPAFPFFILSVISTTDTFGKTLNQEITSQGHCYQALIFLYLRKEGVKNEEIDTYLNFLTELAFSQFKAKRSGFYYDDFDIFLQEYRQRFNLPIAPETIIRTLRATRILSQDSFGTITFSYPYIYYFFVAKYLSDNIDSCKKTIDQIMTNLHTDENAYIAIFISHHSRNDYILDEITLNASSLFESYKSASLTRSEFIFFDEQISKIAQEVLPQFESSPEYVRAQKLKEQDAFEEDALLDDSEPENILFESSYESDPSASSLDRELRRSIKTVEVMGQIIKSRAGSLKKQRLEEIFEEGMNVHLRILSCYLEQVKHEEEAYTSYISERIRNIYQEKAQKKVANSNPGKPIYKPTHEDIAKISRAIFWSLNLGFVYALIDKIVHSIGSNKLTDVVVKICDKNDSPAAKLIKHGILMWYNKNVQVETILREFLASDFSETAKKTLRIMIATHCSMHQVTFRDKQKLEKKLDIPLSKLARKID